MSQGKISMPYALTVTAQYDTDEDKLAALFDERARLQEQYDGVVNSEAYINENWFRWLELADPNTVLTKEGKREAATATQIINNYILARDIEDDWFEYSIVDNRGNYTMLAMLLDAKSNKSDAFLEGVKDALFLDLNPYYQEIAAQTQMLPIVTETPLKTYAKAMLENKMQFSDLSREAYPGYYMTGNITTSVAMLALGAEALGAMGIASSAVKSAILFGGTSALQSVSEQDWSKPGEAIGNVAIDTGVGILSGYVGGKAAQLAVSKVGLILESSNLSVDAINFLLSGTGGFSFAAAQTGTLEAAKLIEAGIKGEEYQFDAAGAAINITISTLFAALEVLKSKYLTDPVEYKLASEIEQSLRNGETDGVEKAVAFINEKAESVDLKAIENSNPALAGGKSEGYNGSGSSLDDAINKYWYGDKAYYAATGAGEMSFTNLDDFINNPSKLNNIDPTNFYNYLESNGYNPIPLSRGSTAGISFEYGGGFKVNWWW